MGNSLTVHLAGIEPADFEALVSAPRTINSALIPLEAARNAVAVLGDALVPSTNDQAVRNAALLIGSYPKHAVDAPEIYTRAIKSVLARFPQSVGAAAVDALTLRLKFIPTRAEVNEECERQAQPMLDALASARWMTAEHRRRREEAENEAAIEASKAAFKAKHGGKSPLEVLGARFSAEEPVGRGRPSEMRPGFTEDDIE